MKRDPDLERQILLAIEAYNGEGRPVMSDNNLGRRIASPEMLPKIAPLPQ